MSAYVLPVPAVAVVPVAGGDRLFPVRRVYCVGRNYAEHAREMGFSERDPPFFFCKPADAIVPVREGATAEIAYPGAAWFELQPGDLVFTGTPAGVGPVRVGQKMIGAVDGLGELHVRVVAAAEKRLPACDPAVSLRCRTAA